ncbi:MAG TPA: hypothetical protein RMH99_22140, partial [Sandaracinaceae bacterium LLY-WYZ-13_1]|nr:hypothetical protein [Sandaracinaceae bacterium LLY-WYZ-13_1]
RALPSGRVRRLAGPRAALVAELAGRGLVGVVGVRLVPVASFTTVNLVLGDARITLRDLVLGTILGVAPGIAAFAFVTTRVLDAVRDPSAGSVGVAGASVLGLLGLLLGLRHLLARRRAAASEEARGDG